MGKFLISRMPTITTTTITSVCILISLLSSDKNFFNAKIALQQREAAALVKCPWGQYNFRIDLKCYFMFCSILMHDSRELSGRLYITRVYRNMLKHSKLVFSNVTSVYRCQYRLNNTGLSWDNFNYFFIINFFALCNVLYQWIYFY